MPKHLCLGAMAVEVTPCPSPSIRKFDDNADIMYNNGLRMSKEMCTLYVPIQN